MIVIVDSLCCTSLEIYNRPRSEVLHGIFELSPTVVMAIKDGTSLFAVDGQRWNPDATLWPFSIT
jgi:hypothetical protein